MTVNTDSEKIKEILTRRVDEVIEKESLERKLKSGKRLIIKLGADPTSPDLHLGHTICLGKLKEFQDLGHKIMFIIGDFTARIGDPSGRIKTRPALSEKEIKNNTRTYFEQVGKILDIKKTEIRRNSEWFSKMSFTELFRLSHFFTINQILEGNIFRRRWEAHQPIWLHEFFYPILQAYDSVMIKADVEIGGTDQLFNMMAGRILQPYFKQSSQDIITQPLLLGLDGKQKMSKSLGNYVGITEKPESQYGKIMSIPDSLILHYFELCTDISLDELERIKKDFKNPNTNPRDLKARLAKEIVAIYHGRVKAKKAGAEFNKVFQKKEIPQEIKSYKIEDKTLNILDLLTKIKFFSSKSQARHLIEQGGVKTIFENKKETISDWKKEIEIKRGMVIQVGKRRFARLAQ